MSEFSHKAVLEKFPEAEWDEAAGAIIAPTGKARDIAEWLLNQGVDYCSNVTGVDYLEREVKEKKTIINLVSFDDVVATGDKTKILEYMAGINLQDRKAFNSSKFMWMMKDKKFFTKVVALIR